jgi:hypothetical protein
MERRAHERYEVQFETRVTVLGNDQGHSAFGHISDISATGLSVNLPFQLAAGDMVELELADSTLYGQVVYSNPDYSSFRTGIEASRVMLGSTNLASILQRILMEQMPSIQGLQTAEPTFG